MQKKTYFFQMEVKQVENDEKSGDVIIEGYASTPDVDRYSDIVEPSAFSKALEMYMKNPVLLYQHDANIPVGVIQTAKVTEKGLWIRAAVKDEDAKQKVLDDRLRALSIGFIPLLTELQHEDGTPFNFEEDSIWDSNLIRVIKELDLVEISIVSTPANGNALFSVAAATKMYFQDVITKSFGMKNKKDTKGKEVKDTTDEEVVAPVATPETDEAIAEEDTPAEEVATEEKAPETETPETPEEAAPEAAETPEKESEKAGEDPAPATDEGAPAEGSVTVDKSEASAEEGAEGGEEKKIIVDEEDAKSMHMLVKAGVVTVAKEGEEAMKIDKHVVSLIEKMSEQIAADHKKITDLEAKLDETPEKKSLVLHGQFEAGSSTEEVKNGEASPTFQSLIANARR